MVICERKNEVDPSCFCGGHFERIYCWEHFFCFLLESQHTKANTISLERQSCDKVRFVSSLQVSRQIPPLHQHKVVEVRKRPLFEISEGLEVVVNELTRNHV